MRSDILFTSGAHFNKKHWNLFTIRGFDKRPLSVLTGVKRKIIIRKCFWKISKRAPILQLRNHPCDFSCLFFTYEDGVGCREKFVLKKKAPFILIYIRWKIRQHRVFLGTRWKKEHVWYFDDKVFSFFFYYQHVIINFLWCLIGKMISLVQIICKLHDNYISLFILLFYKSV